MKRFFLVFLVLVILMTGLCSAALAAKEITPFTKCGTHGTAKRLNGRTAIVSVFASDSKTRWNFDNSKDLNRYMNANKYLGIGKFKK